MTWYKDWFRDANYSVVYEHRDEIEAEQMLDLIERCVGHDPARRVLDVGCGSGRHTIAFAKRGYADVTGIDLSPALLAEGRKEAARLELPIRFIESDMREIPEETFDLALNLFTSFGYFESDEDNSAVILRAANHLAKGGWFVLDFLNSHWVREHFVAHDERVAQNGTHVEQTRWIENNRIEKRLLLRNNFEAKEYIESVRLFELSDFERMFSNAGLTIRHLFGTYAGSAFDPDTSPRLIMFAER
ncbi:MAG TPA: methyltransferase domain-containing protein [Candidatus Kapabacteria bacterium]|nr:methyltransferase domain-containing protein [Candidatus Kapabacteria bacterium]